MTTEADAAARVLRGRTVSFRDDPRVVGPDRAMQSHEDGAVVVGLQGRILWHGAFADLAAGARRGAVRALRPRGHPARD